MVIFFSNEMFPDFNSDYLQNFASETTCLWFNWNSMISMNSFPQLEMPTPGYIVSLHNSSLSYIACWHCGTTGAVTEDVKEVFCADTTVTLPEEGVYCVVELTATISPSHFYVMFPFGTKSIAEILEAEACSGEWRNEETGD